MIQLKPEEFRSSLTHFTLKEEIVMRVLPTLIDFQLHNGANTMKGAQHEAASAAVQIANATIAALEMDE